MHHSYFECASYVPEKKVDEPAVFLIKKRYEREVLGFGPFRKKLLLKCPELAQISYGRSGARGSGAV